MTIATDDFWRFSLKLYQIEQVKNTLLSAQDNFALNVNLALFCLYLNQQDLYLTDQQMAQLKNELDQFSQQFTGKLRALRLQFRQQQKQLQQYDELKQSLLKAELILEQQEQNLLCSVVAKWQTFSNENSDNLATYNEQLLGQTPQIHNSTLKLSDLNQYIH